MGRMEGARSLSLVGANAASLVGAKGLAPVGAVDHLLGSTEV